MATGYLLVPESFGPVVGFSGMAKVADALARPTPQQEKLQLWFTNEYNKVQAWVTAKGAPIILYRRKKDLPMKWAAFTVAVRRRDSPANSGLNPRWVRLADCGVADYFRVWTNGAQTVGDWRVYGNGGTVARFRPLTGETLRDYSDLFHWAGDALAPNPVPGSSGEYEADSGPTDGNVEDLPAALVTELSATRKAWKAEQTRIARTVARAVAASSAPKASARSR